MQGKGERPRWRDDFCEKEAEWVLIDPSTDRMKLVRTATAEEALGKALEMGIQPGRPDHVRPLRGKPRDGCMSKEEFQRHLRQ